MFAQAPRKLWVPRSSVGAVIIPQGRSCPSQVTQKVLLPARQRMRSVGSS